jgi:hypothetical protein
MTAGLDTPCGLLDQRERRASGAVQRSLLIE